MFLDIEGVKGESRDINHAQPIDVLAWSWGMSNRGAAHVGGGAGADDSGPAQSHQEGTIQPLMETKRMPELRPESQPAVLERTPLPAIMKFPPAPVHGTTRPIAGTPTPGKPPLGGERRPERRPHPNG